MYIHETEQIEPCSDAWQHAITEISGFDQANMHFCTKAFIVFWESSQSTLKASITGMSGFFSGVSSLRTACTSLSVVIIRLELIVGVCLLLNFVVQLLLQYKSMHSNGNNLHPLHWCDITCSSQCVSYMEEKHCVYRMVPGSILSNTHTGTGSSKLQKYRHLWKTRARVRARLGLGL